MNTDANSNATATDSGEGETAGANARADRETPQAELAAQQERYLRLAADFDNFRKRTARDAEQRANAQKDAFIRELLPILDNLERALASDPSTSATQIRRGVEMILQQLLDLLRRHGIEPEENVGEVFDAHRHEAINARFDPAKPDHTVIEVVQRGYRRGDAVIRPAKVIINDHNFAGDEGGHGG